MSAPMFPLGQDTPTADAPSASMNGLVTDRLFLEKPILINSRAETECDSQVGGFALLHLLALAAGGSFFAAQCPRDAHEQSAVTQEEAADVHKHKEQQERPETQAHHRAQSQAAEQGFC